jgi:hypothetical protein
MHVTRDELERRFAHHPPQDDDTVERHEQVRATLLDTADTLIALTGPPTREQSTMLTKLEEAMFWANAAVARPLT